MIETDSVQMRVVDYLNKNAKASSQNRILSTNLNKGYYEVIFTSSDPVKQKFHLTIMMAETKFIVDSYINPQGKALKNCDQNKNFPLAMNK